MAKERKLDEMSIMELALFDKVKETQKRKELAEVLTTLAIKAFTVKGFTDEFLNTDIKEFKAEAKEFRKQLIQEAIKTKQEEQNKD